MEYFNPLTSVPPEDPNAWTDEQWIDWLKATDAEAGPTGEYPVGYRGQSNRPLASRPGARLGQCSASL